MTIEELLMLVKVQPVTHKGKRLLTFHFPYDPNIIAGLKSIFPSARWSYSGRFWHLPDLPSIRNLLHLQYELLPPKKLARLSPEKQAALTSMYEQLLLKAYSSNTQKVYLNEFNQLLIYLGSSPVNSLTPEQLRDYFLYCINSLNLSENQIHSRINAIKFYFENVLGNAKMFFELPRPKKRLALPKVLSTKDIISLFNNTTNLKHKLMLKLCYGMGLRVSELTRLKIADIDSKRMQVHIENSKGKKDRMVTLPESILSELRSYYKQYKPEVYLFEGQFGGPYSIRSAQSVFKTAMQKAGIQKNIGIHSLRHSYATHLLESGTDISYIKNLLGHNDIKTTMIYLNVSNRDSGKIKSPLDQL